MDERRFRDILDAYGAEPRRWPERERAAALAFLRDHPQAEQWRTEAAALDAALDEAPPARPSDLLARRVLATAPRTAAPAPRFAGAALAAALAVGVLLGFGGVRAGEEGAEVDALLTAAFDTPALLDDAGLGG